jgi:cell fate (sporulation/competence/biofilm development) regulator YlbF (YheA/YmcA/DUF963 family)
LKEDKIWEGVRLICDTIRESQEYALHEKTLEALKKEPEKVQMINEFRAKKYKQQNGIDDGCNNTLEELFRIQRGLRGDALCSQFLESDAALCNIIRKAVEQIMDVVPLDIPLQAEGEEEGNGSGQA